MNPLARQDELVRQALQLAFFLQGDRATAQHMVMAAMEKLEVVAAAQYKRLYYTPRGRKTSDGVQLARTKVSLQEPHLLQRLLYAESEPYEKQKESSTHCPPDEETMLIHFIKHLVRITLKRNSFYVALGFSRLLHQYSTAEAMEIYDVIVQDPERVREEDYYRSRKGKLMKEMKERFGDLLALTRAQRGEERFQTCADVTPFLDVVKECLERFTPWQTMCCIPTNYDRFAVELPALQFDGGDPDDEQPVEVNRLHAILHPTCFAHLIEGLNLDSPKKRLTLPHFALSHSDRDESGPRGGGRALEPDEADLTAIQGYLEEQAARRKHAQVGWLRVLVDGVEQIRFHLATSSQQQFVLPEGAEILEARLQQESREILLATQVLTYNDDDQILVLPPTTIQLEGGQQISFLLTPTSGGSTTVTVGYRETQPLRQAALWWQQSWQRVTAWWQVREGGVAVWQPVMALLILALLTVGVWYFMAGRNTAPDPSNIVREQPTITPTASPAPTSLPTTAPQPTPAVPKVTPSVRETTPLTPTPLPEPVVIARNLPMTERVPRSGGQVADTRGIVEQVATAKKVYLQVSGESSWQQYIHQEIRQRWSLGTRMQLVANADEADVAFKLTVKGSGGGNATPSGSQLANVRISLLVKLVDASGGVVWPLSEKSGGRQYIGPAQKVVEKFIQDWQSDLRRIDQQR